MYHPPGFKTTISFRFDFILYKDYYILIEEVKSKTK